ncbi:hypothetical protein PR202_ga29642 [Eleusine coracana subsp. coracana]|uniref:Uncharacterized protein n=1 Tax=Eleusine coracana subsp. coracana TaxID=191504 RepID=A0AAV5DLT0_ELECO|nr:hypothetical protein PR202_ga29642 [Eleusine coracana subsp. coracana]
MLSPKPPVPASPSTSTFPLPAAGTDDGVFATPETAASSSTVSLCISAPSLPFPTLPCAIPYTENTNSCPQSSRNCSPQSTSRKRVPASAHHKECGRSISPVVHMAASIGNFCAKDKELLKLDIDRMMFYTIDLPHDRGFNVAIVEAGEGKLGMFSHTFPNKYVDYHTMVQNGSRWRMVKRVPVPDTPRPLKWHYIVGVSEQYILLFATLLGEARLGVCFSIETKTLKIEMVTTMEPLDYSPDYFRPYIGYPLFMSPRRI